MNGTAKIAELVLLGGRATASISCDAALVPSPGRYVLAHHPGSATLVASALFLGQARSGGFIASPPIGYTWKPGDELNVRGPLGRGFSLPAAARRVALLCLGDDPTRVLPLAEAALLQSAAVTLICDGPTDQLPLPLEIQPMSALAEVFRWSDYAACDVERETLGDLTSRLLEQATEGAAVSAEVLVRTPLPCGGIADCGVCSVRAPSGYRLACLDGPVFDLSLLMGRG